MDLSEIAADKTIQALAAEYADLMSIQQDLSFVASAAHRYSLLTEEDIDGILHRALSGAAVVAYRRCFTRGKGYGSAKRTRLVIPPALVESLDSACLRDTHQLVLDMADRHVAHRVSDLSQLPISLIAEQDVSGAVLGVRGVAMMHAFYLGPPASEANLLATLAEQLRDSIATMATSKQQRILSYAGELLGTSEPAESD